MMKKILFGIAFSIAALSTIAQTEDRIIVSQSKSKVSPSGVNMGTNEVKTVITIAWSKKYVMVGKTKFSIYDLVTDNSGVWYKCKSGKLFVDIGMIYLPRGVMVGKYYYDGLTKIFTERTLYLDCD